MNDPALACAQPLPLSQPHQDYDVPKVAAQPSPPAMEQDEPQPEARDEHEAHEELEIAAATPTNNIDAHHAAEAEPEAEPEPEADADTAPPANGSALDTDDTDHDAVMNNAASSDSRDPEPDPDEADEAEQLAQSVEEQPEPDEEAAAEEELEDEEKKDDDGHSHEHSNGQAQKPQIDAASPPRLMSPRHGHCSMQGVRPSMEDAVVIESNFTVVDSRCTSGSLSLFAVLDGHGGGLCAEFCAANLLPLLQKYLESEASVERAMTLCIAELDAQAIEYAKDASGSTACIVLMDRATHELWCCNVGDSRCILVDIAAQTSVQQLSVEHKPSDARERKRIEAANGWVTFGRVCGILAVSRSLGDKDFKDEIEDLIISTPDITHHALGGPLQYIVLACDGLYDVFSNEQCMEWLVLHLRETRDVQTLASKLCQEAIHVRHTKDNVSIVLIHVDAHDADAASSAASSGSSSESGSGD